MSSGASKLKEFGKEVRQTKCELEKFFYNNISPIITHIKYDSLTEEAIDEHLESLNEVIAGYENICVTGKGFENQLLKAKADLMSKKDVVVRNKPGRLTGGKNDSGVYSADSTVLTSEDIDRSEATQHDETIGSPDEEGKDTRLWTTQNYLVSHPSDGPISFQASKTDLPDSEDESTA